MHRNFLAFCAKGFLRFCIDDLHGDPCAEEVFIGRPIAHLQHREVPSAKQHSHSEQKPIALSQRKLYLRQKL